MTYELSSLQSAEADLRHAEMRWEDADGPWQRSHERKLIDAIKAAIAEHTARPVSLEIAGSRGPLVKGCRSVSGTPAPFFVRTPGHWSDRTAA